MWTSVPNLPSFLIKIREFWFLFIKFISIGEKRNTYPLILHRGCEKAGIRKTAPVPAVCLVTATAGVKTGLSHSYPHIHSPY
jgi:hypothetical protein